MLIAEDHEQTRRAMRDLLEASGFQVLEARTGREAVERSLDGRPDIILMDLMMPELDGFAATRRIRAYAALGDVPIIALSAMEGVRRLVLEAGANDCVRKPVDARGLIAKVERWIKAGTM